MYVIVLNISLYIITFQLKKKKYNKHFFSMIGYCIILDEIDFFGLDINC